MKNMKKKDGWHQKKSYPHFDLPLSFEQAEKLVTSPKAVAEHSFYPFLAYDKTERKVKRVKKRKTTSNKERPIRYAAHKDGYIYAYYSKNMTERYQDKLKELGLDQCVLAYRTDLVGQSNIDFANHAMEEVRRCKTCVVMTCDISGFYDSLDQKKLKEQWCVLLGVSKLPDDHYKIFKSVTGYSLVNRDECYNALGIEKCTKGNPRPALPKPLCASPSEFRQKIRKAGLIKRNVGEDGGTIDHGIPQGAPLSSCLSNIYMLPFDSAMQKYAKEIGGYYRRYCDDILWICDESHLETLKENLDDNIKKAGPELSINPDKTTITHFQACEDGSLSATGDIVQYLGFTFDGKNVYIRSGTMSRFARKVTFAIRRAKIHRRKAVQNGGRPKVCKRKLYKTYTHLGNANFSSYARRAQNAMKSPSIRKQNKKQWDMVQKKLPD